MRRTLQLISFGSLLGVIVPPVLYILDRMPLPSVKTWMLVFTAAWFATVPLWMDRS
jgi:hypothetical protein